MSLETRLSKLEETSCECTDDEYAHLTDEELRARVMARVKGMTVQQIIESFRSVGVELALTDQGWEIVSQANPSDILTCPVHYPKNQ